MPRSMSFIFAASMLFACNGDKGFVTYNNPPAVTIIEPLEGQTFEFGQPVEFLGQVVDDGDVVALAVDWASSIDGVLPDPEPPDPDGVVDFVSSILAQGIHVITLRATDSANEQGESTVEIEILEELVVPDVPAIEIISPPPGVSPPVVGIGGQPFVFAVNASDDLDPPTALVVTLTANPGGQICLMVPDSGGNASCSATMDLGNYLLTFVVEDTDGFTAQASAVFDVVDPDDFDQDGDGWTPNGGDCNDSAPLIYPGAPEECDGLDNDCDPNTAIDVNSPCYDDDGDGYCEVPPCTNATETIPDCDDSQPAVNPMAIEVQNQIDDDCDGLIDEGFGNFDDDGDGFCETPPCTNLPGSLPGDPQDCDDTNGAINPAVPEICGNTVDENCDTLTNEENAVGCTFYFSDQDADGYGGLGGGACWCEPQYPFTANDATDCDDSNPIVNPGQTGWFSSPTNGSFDYNCDGQQEARLTGVGTGCSSTGILSCDGSNGWVGSQPACGQTGQYQNDCDFDLDGFCAIVCGAACIVEFANGGGIVGSGCLTCLNGLCGGDLGQCVGEYDTAGIQECR